MSTNCVEIKNLYKRFSDSTTDALEDININIQKGEITGIVGPDGAGKTTLIRMMIGLLLPNKGSISTLKLSPEKDKNLINTKIGYMPQKFGLYEDLSVMENLILHSELRGLDKNLKEETFKKLLDFTDLKHFKTRLAGRLSGGMKQKLGLACSLIGTPELLLLDEPTVGVDPISRRELMKMVRALAAEGISVIWSTSYLDEAQSFDSCILLNEGKLLYKGIPYDLTKKMVGRVFLTQNPNGNNRTLLKNIIKTGKNITDAVIQGDYVRIVYDADFNKEYHIENNPALQATEPRFEDAVIDILGGCPKGESAFAKNFVIQENGSEFVIEAMDLVKKYGDFYAVKNNTFQIPKGEIFGLLGPNGAGKSTCFKMMCGLTSPTSGTAKIMGQDIRINPSKARSYLGYMAQKFSLYERLSVFQNLMFFSGIYNIKGKNQKEKIDEMIEMFNFGKYLEHNAYELPLGYKQRLALTCAIMHNPPVLFLDEPTSGVDPITRRDFWNNINSLAEKGATIMVTTHFMDEAEYCDRISLFYRGEAIATGTPTELKAMVSENATMEEAFIKLIEKYDEQRGDE